MFQYLKARGRLWWRMRHLLEVQGHILLVVWVQQLQYNATPRLAFAKLAQVALQFQATSLIGLPCRCE